MTTIKGEGRPRSVVAIVAVGRAAAPEARRGWVGKGAGRGGSQ